MCFTAQVLQEIRQLLYLKISFVFFKSMKLEQTVLYHRLLYICVIF